MQLKFDPIAFLIAALTIGGVARSVHSRRNTSESPKTTCVVLSAFGYEVAIEVWR